MVWPTHGPSTVIAFDLHADLSEERLGGVKVLDHDEDVIHPVERHGNSLWSGQQGARKWPSFTWSLSEVGAEVPFSMPRRPISPLIAADTGSSARRVLHVPTALAGLIPVTTGQQSNTAQQMSFRSL
jgi:hypothetical protein